MRAASTRPSPHILLQWPWVCPSCLGVACLRVACLGVARPLVYGPQAAGRTMLSHKAIALVRSCKTFARFCENRGSQVAGQRRQPICPLSPHGSKVLESPPNMTESQRIPRQEMIDIIARIAGEDGDHPTIIPGLSVIGIPFPRSRIAPPTSRAWRSSSREPNVSCSVRKPSSTAPRTTF